MITWFFEICSSNERDTCYPNDPNRFPETNVIRDDYVELIADTTVAPSRRARLLVIASMRAVIWLDTRPNSRRSSASATNRFACIFSRIESGISHGSESRVRQRATGECRVAFTMESSKEERNFAGVFPRFASATLRACQGCANGTIKWPTSRDSGLASALVSNRAFYSRWSDENIRKYSRLIRTVANKIPRRSRRALSKGSLILLRIRVPWGLARHCSVRARFLRVAIVHRSKAEKGTSR